MRFKPTLAVVALLATLAGLQTSHAAEPRGPSFGSNKITTEIKAGPDDAPDVDDYVSALLPGETLKVKLSANKRTSLFPRMFVIDPDGVDRTAEANVLNKNGGRVLQIKKLAIDKVGPWIVRIDGGGNETEGEYTVKFGVKSAKTGKEKKLTLGGAAGLQRVHDIPATDSDLLTATLKFSKKEQAVGVLDFDDPQGDDVPSSPGKLSDDFVTKGTKVSVKKALLRNGSGNYQLTVGIASGTATYDLTTKVAVTGRPKGKQTLSSDEPFITDVEAGLRGVAATNIVIAGQNFSTGELPTVFFDDLTATVISVNGGGSSVTVSPPIFPDGSTVDITVQNPDGQAAARAGFFFYVPQATITDLVDAQGAQVRGGSTLGGQAVRILGTGFEPTDAFRFGGRSVQVPQPVSATEFRLTTPSATAAGPVTVFLTDTFGRVAGSTFDFTYKAPPVLTGTAKDIYSPTVGAAIGGTVVTITGSNFELDDEVLFDGDPVLSQLLSDTQRRFTTPARPAGNYPMALRDRFGSVVAGPPFTVKNPAVITAVIPAAGAAYGNNVGVHGGTLVRVTGSGFHPDDVVRLGSEVVEVPTVATSEFTFRVPTGGATGRDDLVVTDGAAQVGTFTDALNRAGFLETEGVSPGASATDDLTALRVAVGDLDNDGSADDVVIVSDLNDSPGTRDVYARMFFGDEDGNLYDVTADYLPALGDDPSGIDGFDATAVAIGDIDAGSGPQIILAGASFYNYDATAYTGYYFDGVRVLENDGYGTFSFSYDLGPSTGTEEYRPTVYAQDEDGYDYTVFEYLVSYGAYYYLPPLPQAIAIGDVDGDGENDVVVGTDRYSQVNIGVDPDYVDFESDPPYISYDDAQNYYLGGNYYLSAIRVLVNRGNLEDQTARRIPPTRTNNSTSPIFHTHDLALGDVDGDGALDIISTWDEPTTVTPLGAFDEIYYGVSYQTAQISTRVLLNDGYGYFSDETTKWLPAASGNEFWQGNKLAFVNIVGDAKPDLVLLHRTGPSSTTSALRILRNDGSTSGFVNVTATVLPNLGAAPVDNLRGTALAVRDVNGDGLLDILIGTSDAIIDPGDSSRLRSTRLLLNQGNGTWALAPSFLPDPGVDSLETHDIQFISETEADSGLRLLLVTEVVPVNSTGGESLRIFEFDAGEELPLDEE